MTAATNGTAKRAFSIPEAAEAYGVSDKVIRAAINKGHLKAKRQTIDDNGNGVGKYIIKLDALEAWFDGLVDA